MYLLCLLLVVLFELVQFLFEEGVFCFDVDYVVAYLLLLLALLFGHHLGPVELDYFWVFGPGPGCEVGDGDEAVVADVHALFVLGVVLDVLEQGIEGAEELECLLGGLGVGGSFWVFVEGGGEEAGGVELFVVVEGEGVGVGGEGEVVAVDDGGVVVLGFHAVFGDQIGVSRMNRRGCGT